MVALSKEIEYDGSSAAEAVVRMAAVVAICIVDFMVKLPELVSRMSVLSSRQENETPRQMLPL